MTYGTAQNPNDLSNYNDDAFAAYLAGFIDADGSIGIAKQSHGTRSSRPIYRARVQLGQKKSAFSINLLNEIQRRYGGNLHTVKRHTSYGNEIRIELVKYVSSNEGTRSLLEAIQPYLTQKYDQAAAALAFLDLRQQAQHPWSDSDRKGMELLYLLVKELIEKRNK